MMAARLGRYPGTFPMVCRYRPDQLRRPLRTVGPDRPGRTGGAGLVQGTFFQPFCTSSSASSWWSDLDLAVALLHTRRRFAWAGTAVRRPPRDQSDA